MCDMLGARRFHALLALVLLTWSPRSAHAWVETHLVSDEIRVQVERSGMALVEHAVTLRVQGGPLRSFDLAIADTEALPEASGTATAAQGEGLALPLQVETRPDGALRVNVESSRGVSRGLYLFRVRYRTNLLGGDSLRREGAMVRLRLRGPAWQEGLDNARCTFVLPSAPSEPRVAADVTAQATGSTGDDESESGAFIPELKRYADRDELMLIRPHVARSEAVMWSVRIDPRALAEAHDDRLRPPPALRAPAEMAPAVRLAYGLAGLFLVVGFSILVACKARHTARQAQGLAKPRSLLPLPVVLRVALAGPALAAGLALQLWAEAPWCGTALVLLAMTAGWYQRPVWLRTPRGPGRWLALSDQDAFSAPAPARDAWLDASTKRGALTFALALLTAGATALIAAHFATHAGYVVLFDSAVLVPLFGTGRRRDLPPHPIAGAAPTLWRIAKKLRTDRALRTIAWARLPDGSDTFDELRLLCAPRVPLRGFSALEIGLLTLTGMGGSVQCPEILIRVLDGSPCHDALVRVLRGARFVRGRKPEERVVTVRPRLPSAAMTAALALRLLRCAEDSAVPQPAKPAKAGNTAARSSGMAERTANVGTSASPLQAM
jgi:hypothetical protein